MANLRPPYNSLKALATANLGDIAVTQSIIDLAKLSFITLKDYTKHPINSSIANKEYFVFERQGKYSRPVNTGLFIDEIPEEIYSQYLNLEWNLIPPDMLQKVLYSIAMAYCAATDALGTQDKKTPSTFYEIYIGNIFAREYGTNPISQIEVDLDEISTTLPTDYLFQPPNQFIKIHLPIKLSTRERSIQAWAHQRVLEGIHGVGRYKGVMVVMAETNFVSKSMSVVEVCLPDQWRLYQMFISQMTRIYYLDMPKKYEELPEKFPHIQVKPFSDFFNEKAALVTPDAV